MDAAAAARCPGVDLAQAPKLSGANGKLVAAGFAQRSTISGDGVTWELDQHVAEVDAAEPAVVFSAIAAGPGLLVAAAGRGVFTSNDGATWTPRAVPNVSQYVRYDNGFVAAAYGKGRYVVAASASYNKQAFYQSADGVTWPDAPFVPNEIDVCCRPIRAIVFANDKFVAVGAARRSIVSDDGISWHDDRSPVDQDGKMLDDSVSYYGLAFGNGRWVAVGLRSIIAHSPNGIDWTDATTKPVGDFMSVVFDGSKFITCARTGCFSSTDGVTWTSGPGTLTDPRPTIAMMREGSLFIGLDVPAKILTSNDGMTWTPVFCGAPPQLRSLGFLAAQ
jgi:hypothetical protein